MKIFPKFIIWFILFTYSYSAFSQAFNDTIFTKNNDTIICHITLVNDHNIFYKYKKKKRSKAADISQEEVLFFKSDNPKLLNLVNIDRFPKCDNCENFLVFTSGDTVCYNLKCSFFDENNRFIKSAYLGTPNSVTLYEIDDIEFIKWNNIDYNSIEFSERNRQKIMTYNGIQHLNYNSFLSRLVIDGGMPLYGFYFFGSSFYYAAVPITTEIHDIQYYTIIDNEIILIPKRKNEFIDFVQAYLISNNSISNRLNNKLIRYDDIEEIFKLYNE